MYAFHYSYSEGVGAVKIVYYKLVQSDPVDGNSDDSNPR